MTNRNCLKNDSIRIQISLTYQLLHETLSIYWKSICCQEFITWRRSKWKYNNSERKKCVEGELVPFIYSPEYLSGWPDHHHHHSDFPFVFMVISATLVWDGCRTLNGQRADLSQINFQFRLHSTSALSAIQSGRKRYSQKINNGEESVR